MGVMLALSAIFAVVLSTISLPNDKATAQVADADDAVTKRAAAWFNSLTLDEAINAILGADTDAVTDVDGDADTQGRQYVDADDPAVNNLPIEFIYAAWTAKSDTQSFYDGLPADTNAENDSGTANKAGVNVLVDGNPNTTGDIYAVGDGVVTNGQAIRGFQSVQVWWTHLTCTEARIAIGEDNDDLDEDTDTGTAGDQPETSAVCDPVYDPNDATNVTSFAKKSYADVKSVVDPVSQAILGLSSAGSANSGDDPRAMRWWNVLSAQERVYALYGDGVTVPTAPSDPGAGTAQVVSVDRLGLAALPYSEIATGKMYTYDRDGVAANGEEISVALDDDSKALVPEVKALINDRADWVYGPDAPYSGPYEGLFDWWNSIGCTEMQISVGEDNEPVASMPGEFCVMEFGALSDTHNLANDEVSQQERALTAGRALLNLKSLPQVGAWWDELDKQQMVNVVYGLPLVTEDADDDDMTAETPVASVTDREKFQKMYAGIVMADEMVTYSDLPAITLRLLARRGVTDAPNDMVSVRAVVDAIANEIFDPPDGSDNDPLAPPSNIQDDGMFNPPYSSVGDWWNQLDCRVMRLAVGEDNNYLNPLVPGEPNADPVVEDTPQESSAYCALYPNGGMNDLLPTERMRVDVVGIALLARSEPGRFMNTGPNGNPTIATGTAQVGAMLTAERSQVTDDDGTTTSTFKYQWIRTKDGTSTDVAGQTNSTYVVRPEDVDATISVRVTYTDDDQYYEMARSAETTTIAGSPGEISRIEATIRSVTVSGGDEVTLSVDIYGLQDAKDNGIGATFAWTLGDDTIKDSDGDPETGREINYTAPSQSGTYTVTASLGGGECQPDTPNDATPAEAAAIRDADCSASITVQVRRPSAPVADPVPPVNPPGEIQSLIPDEDGNQYEVFTPVEGGTFDGGEGYSISVPSGAVPNGEYIGIRMSDDGAVSNLGMTHQRYTLGGNSYGVHAVDASGAAISSYALEDPASVCVPLPAAMRTNISQLALVAINADGSLTILAAQVRLDTGTGNTMVCGNLSTLPASVAVGAQGAPDAIPTATPVPEPVLPVTGGASPTSGSLVWILLLGTAVVVSGTFIVVGRRRKTVRIK